MNRPLKNQNGFSLIEVLTVIAVVGVLVSMVSIGPGILQRRDLQTSSTKLYADLQAIRISALTKNSDPDSLGFGLRFIDGNSYQVSEFIDSGLNDYSYEADDGEVLDFENTLSSGVTVTIGAAGTPVGQDKALLYDKRGMARSSNWAAVTDRTYVLSHLSLSTKKCVTVSIVRIREGSWDGTDCTLL